MIGLTYFLDGEPVVVLARWSGRHCPRNVLIRRADGTLTVRPFRGLRKNPPPEGETMSATATEHTREELLAKADRIADGASDVGMSIEALRLTIAATLFPTAEPRAEKPCVPEGWYEVELMGHRQRWAHIRPIAFAGRQLVEVTQPSYPTNDPASSGDDDPEMRPALVEYYSPSAIYCLSPSTEAEVMAELVERATGIPF